MAPPSMPPTPSGPTCLLDEAVSTGFRHIPPDAMWMTTMLGYAILAIELEDLDAAARLLPVIEPFAGEVATNLGPDGHPTT
jgi:hypothetical protein